MQTRPTNTQLAERPAYLGAVDSMRGRETMDSGDVTLPRLAIAQSTSPQRKRINAKFIEGLEEGQLFNSLTREIYGELVGFIPVRLDKRAMEFHPKQANGELGGIKDRNVPWDDPRCDFRGEEKPIADRFYDYLGLAVRNDGSVDPVVLSMSRTKLKVAKQFNGLIQLARGDMFSGLYKITTVGESSGANSWFNFKIEPAGYPTEAQHAAALALFDEMKGKVIAAEEPEATEGAAGDDMDFPPAGATREPGSDDDAV